MKQINPTIVLTGGGSGGHITPLLSLAHALKKIDPACRIIYIGLKADKISDLKTKYQVFDSVYYVSSGKFRRYHGESFISHLLDVKTLLLNIRDLFAVGWGIIEAWQLLNKIKPTIVFSKGSFVVVPVGIAARLSHIPIITHDSDTVPGLANRIIGRWAKVHAVGMPAENYAYSKESIYYTGIPVSEDFQPVAKAQQSAYKSQLGIPHEVPVLLVGGAGLGARDVNNKIIELAPRLLTQFPGLRILHISGQQLSNQVQSDYLSTVGEQGIERIKVVGFTTEFYKYSGAADLVISRAGATTIAELAMQKKALILIPAPFLAGGHQSANAVALEKAGAAKVLSADVQPSKLLSAIVDLLSSASARQKLADNLAAMAQPHAAQTLAQLVLETAKTDNR